MIEIQNLMHRKEGNQMKKISAQFFSFNIFLIIFYACENEEKTRDEIRKEYSKNANETAFELLNQGKITGTGTSNERGVLPTDESNKCT